LESNAFHLNLSFASCEITPFPTLAQELGSQFLLHYTKLGFKWPFFVCPPPISSNCFSILL
jgi:hypothetical protein